MVFHRIMTPAVDKTDRVRQGPKKLNFVAINPAWSWPISFRGSPIMTEETKDDSAGRRFRQLREQLGMTQTDVARRASVAVSTVSRFERGLRVRPKVAERLWRALRGRRPNRQAR
ncbi:MAG: helix-turn-helix transcriptional regulator [Deltaproteobacteria bacterium]|nr:helix-turn-helix transcriptional regulator [Deltaproteobacteria bacterium]